MSANAFIDKLEENSIEMVDQNGSSHGMQCHLNAGKDKKIVNSNFYQIGPSLEAQSPSFVHSLGGRSMAVATAKVARHMHGLKPQASILMKIK